MTASIATFRMIFRCQTVATIFACLLFTLFFVGSQVSAQTLIGRAVLPADTFLPGPTSGQFITASNGRTPPFVGRQPVQGFSAVIPDRNSRSGRRTQYLGMSDNGFGAKNNSADTLLRVYRVEPDFQTANRGSGRVFVSPFFTLSDPFRKVNFAIVADAINYPNSTIPVDRRIRRGRQLTGADFDIESFRQAPDGTFYFGDEFGPFLIHTDAQGRVIEAPIALPDVASPDDPFGRPATLPRSRGFEGMALNKSGNRLYPMLEGSLTADADQRRLIINEYDLEARAYTGRQFFYRLEATTNSGQAIGDFTAISDRRFLVIERDSGQGATALFKRIYLVDLNVTDAQGFLVKRQVADLLNLADPNNIGGSGTGVFTFPFTTIESVLPLDTNTLLVINDNNYPFSTGRQPGVPDNNEFITIRLNQTLEDPLILGHRGASGYRPEHTLEAYRLAVELGADYIEPDLVPTRDGVLVARHENALAIINPTTGALVERTTDINVRPEFANRLATKSIDGVSITGWFTEDLTLAELKTLRAVERIPQLRPQNTAFDGQFLVPTLQEVIDLAQELTFTTGRTIGIYPETKHPTYFDGIGLSLEEPLVQVLNRNGYRRPDSPVFIQSFEVANLKELRTMTRVPIVQLLNNTGRPFDFVVSGDPRTYVDLTSPANLAEIATYANGIGPNKNLVIPRNAANGLLAPTTLVDDAHRANLLVHPFTFRNENFFLPAELRLGDPNDPFFLRLYGNAAAEYELFFNLGIDGLFTDNTDTAVAVRNRLFR